MDLSQLAQTGAASIVGAMATDTWSLVRDRLANLLGGGDTARERDEAEELEASHRALAAADETQRSDQERDLGSELRGRIKERLRDDPRFAVELSALIEEIRERNPPTSRETHIQATADRGSTVIQAGRDVIGDNVPRRRKR
jgi:hypothetical protein